MDNKTDTPIGGDEHEAIPSPEVTAELFAKASKVSAWITALKQKSKRRPFVGISEDGKFRVTLRDYRIVSLDADESLAEASAQDIVSHLCEAHNDALDKLEAWSNGQYEAIARTVGIGSDFEIPF